MLLGVPRVGVCYRGSAQNCKKLLGPLEPLLGPPDQEPFLAHPPP